jgi:phage terminase small subunit
MPRPRKNAAKPARGDELKPLSPREDMFCREYLVDQVAAKAAVRAGYSANGATAFACRLMKRPHILRRIAELREARESRVDAKADDVVRRLLQIVNADARSLTSHLVGACRYCHGIDNAFQWRTEREYLEAKAEAEEKGKKEIPDCSGGFGYRLTNAPNPDCPECDGLGRPYTRFADTSRLSGDAAILFEGVKETRNGIEFKMADKGKALERLADHLGIYSKQATDTANAFTDMVNQLLRANHKHSSMPIKRDGDE